jgi:broad specificity phosphatase PhoE
MRFGRDGNGAVVYVHTDTLPDWVPLAGEVRVLKTWSDGMQSVVDALADLGAGTTAEIAALPTVDIGERQVLDHLNSLCDRGVLARHRDPDDGRAVRWTDVGLDELNGHGAVELDTDTRGRLPSLEELEVHELERMSRYYTWEFVNSARETVDARDQRGESTTRVADRATNGGDPPPEGAD